MSVMEVKMGRVFRSCVCVHVLSLGRLQLCIGQGDVEEADGDVGVSETFPSHS